MPRSDPPLRTEADRKAIIEGLADGTLDVIASDHAPHTFAQKSREFDNAPFGSRLETTLGLVLTELVQKDYDAQRRDRRDDRRPGQSLGLPGGHLSPGAPADVVLIDLKNECVVDQFASKSQNTPLKGGPCRDARSARLSAASSSCRTAAS